MRKERRPFNPQKYEEYLKSLEKRGPFTVWSGKSGMKQQFPPQWGHNGKETKTALEGVYRWFDVAGEIPRNKPASYSDKPYVVDRDGKVVLSMTDEEAVAFLKWLDTPGNGGTVGLLRRNGIEAED